MEARNVSLSFDPSSSHWSDDVHPAVAGRIEAFAATLAGALGGERRESRYVPIIDFGERKHTAFLPYGLLVMDDAVVMLHGRFRIALSFPDLTMGTFSKIMAPPGDIKKLMQALAE